MIDTDYGDMTYNLRRGLLGAIPVQGHAAYHLFNFDTSKNDNIVNLKRKSKWHSQYPNTRCNSYLSHQFVDSIYIQPTI